MDPTEHERTWYYTIIPFIKHYIHFIYFIYLIQHLFACRSFVHISFSFYLY
jgi:hypothetical protein